MIRHLLITACLTATTLAEPLNQSLVPANTKWLLHLDGDAFQKTRIGKMIIDERAEPELRKAEKDAKTDFDFSFHKIQALTAFGSIVGNELDATLLIQTTADLRADLSKLIAITTLSGATNFQVTKLHNNGLDLYKIGEDLHLMPATSNLWILGKNKTAVQAARAVTLGQADALKQNDFMKFPAIENTFFFMAAADTGAAGNKLPAQARILQKADGGRILLGEKGDQLFLNFALKSRDADTITQIKEVLIGLKALLNLGIGGDKDLSALTSSATISSTDNIVSVNLSFPVKRAMQKVREEQ